MNNLGNPIAFYRSFVTITGSVTASVMLSQALYWSTRTKKPGGWFYKSAKDWTAETGLTRHEQDKARAILRELNLFSELRKGIPATIHFRVNKDILDELLANRMPRQCHGNAGTMPEKLNSLPESGKPDCHKPANLIAENRHSISETTSKTTQKNTGKKERQHSASADVEYFLIPSADEVNDFGALNELPMKTVVVWWKVNNHFGWVSKGRKIRDWKRALLEYVKRYKKPKRDAVNNDEFWKRVREAELDEDLVNEWVSRMQRNGWEKKNAITGDTEPIRDFFASVTAFCDMAENTGAASTF